MELWLTLIGLILIIEALPYAACPEAMQRWLRQIQEVEPATMRRVGLIALGFGFFLCYLAQRTELFS